MMKKTLSALLAGLLFLVCLCTPISAYASTTDDIGDTPTTYYLYTISTSSVLSFSGSTATCKSTVCGMNGYVTKIVFTQKLQKKVDGSWTTIKTWTTTKNQTSASVVNSKSSMSTGTYRLKTSAKVYNGTAYETVTSTSTTIIYG